MPNIEIGKQYALLTGNGGADGYVKVTSNANFWPGATVWLYASNGLHQEAIITDVVSTTDIGIRFKRGQGQGQQCGRSDCSAFLTANAASISQEMQTVRVIDSVPVKRTLI